MVTRSPPNSELLANRFYPLDRYRSFTGNEPMGGQFRQSGWGQLLSAGRGFEEAGSAELQKKCREMHGGGRAWQTTNTRKVSPRRWPRRRVDQRRGQAGSGKRLGLETLHAKLKRGAGEGG